MKQMHRPFCFISFNTSSSYTLIGMSFLSLRFGNNSFLKTGKQAMGVLYIFFFNAVACARHGGLLI